MTMLDEEMEKEVKKFMEYHTRDDWKYEKWDIERAFRWGLNKGMMIGAKFMVETK